MSMNGKQNKKRQAKTLRKTPESKTPKEKDLVDVLDSKL